MSLFWIGLIATVVVGAGTYLTRASFILALADRDLPPNVRSALQFVAPAVLAALVVSLLLDGEGGAVGWPQIGALIVGGVAGWKTRSLMWVLVTGMGTLWILEALI
jgi:branched-subunit amino acid transport protein